MNNKIGLHEALHSHVECSIKTSHNNKIPFFWLLEQNVSINF